jgi:hypothetical protein
MLQAVKISRTDQIEDLNFFDKMVGSMSTGKESADFMPTSTAFIFAQFLEESHARVDENSFSSVRITVKYFYNRMGDSMRRNSLSCTIWTAIIPLSETGTK